jgi:uncharacterized membrane protein YtjA (UPF0391 family)
MGNSPSSGAMQNARMFSAHHAKRPLERLVHRFKDLWFVGNPSEVRVSPRVASALQEMWIQSPPGRPDKPYVNPVERNPEMLKWTLAFLVLALVAGFLGLVAIAGTAAWIAKVLFVVFLVLFLVSLIRRKA